jgi:hypothetical protein
MTVIKKNGETSIKFYEPPKVENSINSARVAPENIGEGENLDPFHYYLLREFDETFDRLETITIRLPGLRMVQKEFIA